MVQQEIHGYVLGLTSQQKRVVYLYGPAHLKFKFGQAYEEQFNLLPFDTSRFAQLQPIVGSAPERPQAEAMHLFQAVTPFVGAFDDSGKGKKLTGVVGPGGVAAPAQPVQQYNPPPPQSNGQTAPAPQQVWYPREDSEWQLYDALVDQNLEAISRNYSKVVARFPDKSEEFQRTIAVSNAIETARQMANLRGYALGKVTPPPDPRDQAILNCDPFNFPDSLFEAIQANHVSIAHVNHAKNIVKLYGYVAIPAKDSNVWLTVAHIAWDHADLRASGKEEAETVHEVAARYGIPVEVLKV